MGTAELKDILYRIQELFYKHDSLAAQRPESQKAPTNALFEMWQLRRRHALLNNDERGFTRQLMEVRSEKEKYVSEKQATINAVDFQQAFEVPVIKLSEKLEKASKLQSNRLKSQAY